MSTFLKSVLLPALVAALVALALGKNISVAPGTIAPPKESAYERVMRTGTLRCGYAVWPKLLEVDPNTRQFSGIMHDYMAALGEAMQLKIEWAEEMSYGDLPIALRDGRIDVFCGGAWTNALRGKAASAVTPLAYVTVLAYTRADNMALDGDNSKMNDPNVKITVIDGESSAAIAATDFPRAQILSMPKNTESAQVLLNVADGKADIVFVDAEAANAFITHNPGKLRPVQTAFPLRVFGIALWTAKNEPALNESLDMGTQQLLYTGVVDRILKKYETGNGIFLRTKMPYVMPIEKQ